MHSPSRTAVQALQQRQQRLEQRLDELETDSKRKMRFTDTTINTAAQIGARALKYSNVVASPADFGLNLEAMDVPLSVLTLGQQWPGCTKEEYLRVTWGAWMLLKAGS
jgi:hypothetical protein